MEDYDKKLKENTDRNWVFIKKFDKWLENKGLSDKTISKHVSNIDLKYMIIYIIGILGNTCVLQEIH